MPTKVSLIKYEPVSAIEYRLANFTIIPFDRHCSRRKSLHSLTHRCSFIAFLECNNTTFFMKHFSVFFDQMMMSMFQRVPQSSSKMIGLIFQKISSLPLFEFWRKTNPIYLPTIKEKKTSEKIDFRVWFIHFSRARFLIKRWKASVTVIPSDGLLFKSFVPIGKRDQSQTSNVSTRVPECETSVRRQSTGCQTCWRHFQQSFGLGGKKHPVTQKTGKTRNEEN